MFEADVDQSQLARAVGCTPGAINQIVGGGVRRSRYLPEIADKLKVSLRWLTGETDDREGLIPSAPPAPPSAIMMSVNFPPERALTVMFDSLLDGIDPALPRIERARLLAQRLPIAMSHLQSLRPDRAMRAPEAAGEDLATQDRELTR